MLKRKEFEKKLYSLIDECETGKVHGNRWRAFVAYSWKKYYNCSNLNLMEVSKYKEIHNLFKANKKFGNYLKLMYKHFQ